MSKNINRRDFLSSASMMGVAATLGASAWLPAHGQPHTVETGNNKTLDSGAEEIKVNFAHKVGKIRPLHGVNNGPKGYLNGADHADSFSQAHIPYVRLHDTEYPYGSGHFVDIPCIFKDFNADPADPASYDFTLTDWYIKAIEDTGAKAFYRLGDSIEHAVQGAKIYHTYPPADFKQWSRICEGIIRHYNEGWADGHHYGIKYWEIWNEPDGRVNWRGTKSEFFQLYETAANHLKRSFPNIKIGGYSACCFFGDQGFLEDFLKYITSPEHTAPLDFLSWHLYTHEVEPILSFARHARARLDAYGFKNTENIFTEWNYMVASDMSNPKSESFQRMRTVYGASFVAKTMIMLQRQTDVALATYYDAQPSTCWSGLFDMFKALKPYYSFKAFGALYALGTEAAIERDAKDVQALAATNGTDGALMLSNFNDDPRKIMVRFSGLSSKKGIMVTVNLLDETHDLETVRSEIFYSSEQMLPITLDKHSVALVTIQVSPS